MMYNCLSTLNINLSENKIELFNKFIKEFCTYNKKINLISKNEINILFEKHIYDSLSVNLFLKKDTPIKVLDIGTGGGFPSLPIAILYDNIKVTAVDSTQKKINVVSEIAKKLDLKNIHPICERAEDLPNNCKNSFDIAASRAMAELRIILEYAIPYVKTGGYFIAYKSIKAEEELSNAENAIKILGVKLVDKIEYSLPLENSPNRVLIVFKKVKDTPEIYPRKNGIISKKPL